MADVVFKRGGSSEIKATPIVDGQILWDTTNGIVYMDYGNTRKIYAVGGADGVRPIEYGGTGVKDSGLIATSLKLDTLDTPSVRIPSAANLNSYKAAGVYICPSATVAATLSNCPFTTGSFVLVVRYVESTSSYVQWIIGLCETAAHVWYIRNCVNGVFCKWRALCDTEHSHGHITGDGRVGSMGGQVLITTENGYVGAVSPFTVFTMMSPYLEDLTNVVVCDSKPTSYEPGNWYLIPDEVMGDG